MILNFTKMQGLGNDFILIDCISQSELLKLSDKKISHLSKILCKRRFGIGADQLLLLSSSQKADCKMRIFNADGSEVQMCGNGVRCIAKYVWKKAISNKMTLTVETLAGIIYLERDGNDIKSIWENLNLSQKKFLLLLKKN